MEPVASGVVSIGMLAVALGVAAALVAIAGRAFGRAGALKAALGLGAWMLLVALLARAGLLARYTPPPPLLLSVALAAAAMVWIAAGPLGKRIGEGVPLAALIALQGFRLPLELVMHRAATEGVMPVQMSFEGANFDVVTGATALLVAALVATGRAPRGLVVGWSVLGLTTLAAIVLVSIASTPTLHLFGSDPARVNTWVSWFPYVWLPTLLVPTALGGHLVILRRALAMRPASGGLLGST